MYRLQKFAFIKVFLLPYQGKENNSYLHYLSNQPLFTTQFPPAFSQVTTPSGPTLLLLVLAPYFEGKEGLERGRARRPGAGGGFLEPGTHPEDSLLQAPQDTHLLTAGSGRSHEAGLGNCAHASRGSEHHALAPCVLEMAPRRAGGQDVHSDLRERVRR